MAQTPCVFSREGRLIPYTPVADVEAGTVVVLGTNWVTIAPVFIEGGTLGNVDSEGVWDMPKTSADFSTAGIPAYWDDNANPYGGTAGSGALSDSSADGPLAGFTEEIAGATTGMVKVRLRSVDAATVPGVLAAFPTRTLAAAGSVIANAAAVEGTGLTIVTAADNDKGVILPSSPTNKVVILKNTVADKTLKVYPNINAGINAVGVNTAYVMPVGSMRMFVGYNATSWQADPETIA